MSILSEPCELRPIRPLDPLEIDGWRLKVHGIAYRRAAPRPELVKAARKLAERVLPRPADGDGRHGVGYMGVHDGRGANFVFIDWWADENELHHHVFISPTYKPDDLEEETGTGLLACVWDLRVICHERQAWIDHVLRNPAGPDLDAYLAARLRADA